MLFVYIALFLVDSNGFPCVRTVLLKGFDERGFIFFTNYQGGKGKQIEQNPHAACVFYWKILERQVKT
jgi:pyridoxamine 5'-phosphate oxidase